MNLKKRVECGLESEGRGHRVFPGKVQQDLE